MFRLSGKKSVFDSIRGSDLPAVKQFLLLNKANPGRISITDNSYSTNSVYNRYVGNLAAGDSLLLCAVKEGISPGTNCETNLQLIKLLLENETIQFNIECEDNHGYNALIIAAAHNRVDIVELLLRAKADLTVSDPINNLTALAWAAKKNSLDMVLVIRAHLLKNPDSALVCDLVTRKDKEDATALDYAVRHANEPMIRVLQSLVEDVLAAEQLINQAYLLENMRPKNRLTYFGVIPKDITEMVIEFKLNHPFRRT